MEDNIKETEIRIIGQDKPIVVNRVSRKWWQNRLLWLFLSALALIALVCYVIFGSSKVDNETIAEEIEDVQEAMFDPIVEEGVFEQETTSDVSVEKLTPEFSSSTQPYCEVKEIVLNDIPLKIYIPVGAKPEFYVGKAIHPSKDYVLAFQAADIRRDNGQVVGACVYNGEVVSTGLAKKGYVAVIDGNISIGVAEQSPLFEEAIQKGGSFFRQYPLVAEGKLIENNPKNKSVRRALCERAGEYFVVESQTAESFHDFSQALVDFKVTTAVYLVGSPYACGFMKNSSGEVEEWGEVRFVKSKNVSYLVWR